MRYACTLLFIGLNAVGIAPAGAQAVIDCNDFWAAGMPLAGHPGGPIYCTEYLPGPGTTALLTGNEYRIFLANPERVRETALDLSNPAIRLRLGWLAEAIDEVVGEYHWIGGARRFYVYVSENPYNGPSGYSNDVYASRNTRYDDPHEPCPLFFYPVSMTQDYGYFKQTLAHEAFHCIQSSTYWNQLRVGANVDYTDWWVEGTAEYFGNVVYPDVNREWRSSRHYDPDASLLEQSYQVNFFFQDLANRIGREGILRLIESLPTVRGAEHQRDALAAFPGIQDHLHEFGQRYLDKRVHDTGVLIVAIDPEKGDAVPITAAVTLAYSAPAFTLERKTLEFAPGRSYRISVDTTGVGRFSARELAEGATWHDLPDELATDCERSRAYEILATSAVPTGAEEYLVDIAITAERTCEVETISCGDGHEHDSCVIGTWLADHEFMAAQMRALLRGRVTIQPITGEERVTYQSDGRAAGVLNTAIQSILHLDSVDLPQNVAVNSQGEAIWSTANGSLYACSVSEVANVTTAPSGDARRRVAVPLPQPREVTSFAYVCGGDVLELTLPGGVMKKRYNRVSE